MTGSLDAWTLILEKIYPSVPLKRKQIASVAAVATMLPVVHKYGLMLEEELRDFLTRQVCHIPMTASGAGPLSPKEPGFFARPGIRIECRCGFLSNLPSLLVAFEFEL